MVIKFLHFLLLKLVHKGDKTRGILKEKKINRSYVLNKSNKKVYGLNFILNKFFITNI